MNTGPAHRRRTQRRWLRRIVIAVVVAAAVIAYVAYMLLGMPGMNHASPPAARTLYDVVGGALDVAGADVVGGGA